MARDGQLGLGANRQLGDTSVPALDNLANTNGTLEWLTSVAGRVELLTVFQSTGVVDGNGVTNLRESLTVTLLQDFDLSGLRSRHSERCGDCAVEVAERDRWFGQMSSANTSKH